MLTNKTSYYDILDVTFDADELLIKTAYRKLARQYHPDLNPDDELAIQKFKKITEAYETLSNKEKRAKYDSVNNFISKNNSTNYSYAKKTYTKQAESKKKPPYNTTKEAKGSFGEVFNDILGNIKNNNQNKSSRPKIINGTDINTNISITQKEAFEGTCRTVNILHTSICPKCNGRRFINGSKCPLCSGKGETSVQKKLTVKIPAFVKEGSKIRIANEGNQGLNGGANGDLYLTISIEKDSQFSYEGSNICTTVPITPFEAALGAAIDVSTPDGSVSMKIPPCTSSGQKFRLAEQGLKDSETNTTGDLVVTVKIALPKELTAEEKELYEKLKLVSKHPKGAE